MTCPCWGTFYSAATPVDNVGGFNESGVLGILIAGEVIPLRGCCGFIALSGVIAARQSAVTDGSIVCRCAATVYWTPRDGSPRPHQLCLHRRPVYQLSSGNRSGFSAVIPPVGKQSFQSLSVSVSVGVCKIVGKGVMGSYWVVL